MAVEVTEALNSRSVNSDGSETLRYLVRGTDNQATALAALLAELPLTWNDMSPDPSPSFDSVWVDTVNSDGAWKGEMTYRPRGIEIGSLRISFDTTGGTMHRTASIETVSKYAHDDGSVPGANAPDRKGAIGVTQDGAVEGVDVPMRIFNFTVEKVWSVATLPDIDDIYALSGLINDTQVSFEDSYTGLTLTFAAGELLFRGASGGSMRGDGGIPYVYHFEASPNETDVKIGTDRITGIEKEGWHYLWVYYGQEKITVGDKTYVVLRPFHAYVEQVLKYGDFSGLELLEGSFS